MQRIRAKFECYNLTPAKDGYPTTAHLQAVINNSDGTENLENKVFSELTPSGTLQICISEKAPAHKYFKVGREYYLDFTRVSLEKK